MPTLADGSVVADPRLGRLAQFDERSRDYPIRGVAGPLKRRSWTWRCPVTLDQGQTSECTGFSQVQGAEARPRNWRAGDPTMQAHLVYQRAKQLDEWPGSDYEGSSVLGATKAAVEQGLWGSYRWAFGVEDLILGVGHAPAVLGINWYERMFDVDQTGQVHVGGDVAGGHAILCNGVNLKAKRFRLHNSWGPGWGSGGEATISFDDVDRLLHEDGDACFPLR